MEGANAARKGTLQINFQKANTNMQPFMAILYHRSYAAEILVNYEPSLILLRMVETIGW